MEPPATAFAGVTQVGRVLLQSSAGSVGRKLSVFDTEDEARRWLAAQTAG